MHLEVNGKGVYAYTGAQALAPERAAVVFVHGAGQDHTVWHLQSRYLAYHGRNVLAPDLPAHGGSEGPPLPTVGDMADWIPRLLDAAELAEAGLVGHSMGALVVLEAAARHPDRVNALALLSIAAPMPVHEQLLAAAQANEHAAFDMVTLWGHGDGARVGGNPSPGMWMTGSGVRLLERSRPGVLYNDLRACSNYADGVQSAARVTCPVLILLGERDLMTPPRAARDVVEALANAETVVLPDCGHMLMTEGPDAVLNALIRFV
ncbi:MAG: alpha/beta hydrolase [Gammaproteobacteria bacterium]|nr:alpha/beta hydrolase [Gammaproteobacteria bacterium]NIR84947.1 alpha/beta hydrolase [Gammaproteobacteria bacterium]NIR91796.1 alpha/beta hydrolase [Gammaproteobacteria bacterium]NIU05994.1 alpha/beta hydrolase [Gammaproteobacteria bacterium]NIV53041.1 alpha/beta fold hydrolase [Gammaproteobacteria bacterium]